MNGDSRSKGDVLARNGRALGAAVSSAALMLGGCAVSFEASDGRRDVVGLFSFERETAAANPATGDVRHFRFYGMWLDDAFRGTAAAIGEVRFSVADLRNQWPDADDAIDADEADDCGEGFWFHVCSLPSPDAARAGQVSDIAVAGLSLGLGTDDRHFALGYHRRVLIEVTHQNALVAWPADFSVRDLLRGSING